MNFLDAHNIQRLRKLKISRTDVDISDNDGPLKIAEIQFGLPSSEDVVRLSHLQIVNRELYRYPVRKPVPYGPLDTRLGTYDKQVPCETCGLRLAECSGHFGHIRFALPVLHVGYLKQTVAILQSICKRCSRVLLGDKERRGYLRQLRRTDIDIVARKALFSQVVAECKKQKNLVCSHCEMRNGSVKTLGTLKLVHVRFHHAKADTAARDAFNARMASAAASNDEVRAHLSHAEEDLDPLRVEQLFQRITPEDVELLDMDNVRGRPENLLIRYLSVPPVPIRPSVAMAAAQGSNEDDLTVKLSQMLIMNSIIEGAIKKGQATTVLMDNWEKLQLIAAKYFNSDQPGIPQSMRDQHPTRSLCQRLKGKPGRFRQNLSGKRVDFSGRTVISPDPNLAIDEVGVPILVAKNLTYPQRVFEHNVESLRRAVVNGPDEYPGANFVQWANGDKTYLRYGDRKRVARSLAAGVVVHRHLVDGDLVLFNRQPSLHRISIMCHRARVMEHRTFRFNECVCAPYNADFDGDEMNLHVPQTEEARAEALILLGVQHNLVTPRSGEPLVAAIQDFLTAAYLLSHKDRFFERSTFARLCVYMGDALERVDLPPPALLRPIEMWTGKQLFLVLVAPSLEARRRVRVNLELASRTYDKRNGVMCRNDGYVYMRNSELLCGVLDKKSLGSGSKSNLFHVLLRDYGPDMAAAAMSRLSKVCSRWLGEHGFSIGIADVQPGPKLANLKRSLVDAGYKRCQDYIDQLRRGLLKPLPGCSAEQTLESVLNGELSEVRTRAGELCKQELHHLNAPLIMTLCGSKGSEINISQMVSVVGQQTVSGGRIPEGFFRRTLPHFEVNAKDPAAKGFVQNSFYSGLTPTEFFFHSMAGREGLVDTAVKTADTGYMQRRLMKALEDLSIHYDGTVRTASGGLVQFHYGDDGLDPATMEADNGPVDIGRIWHRAQTLNPCDDDLPPLSRELIIAFIFEAKLLDERRYQISPRNRIVALFDDDDDDDDDDSSDDDDDEAAAKRDGRFNLTPALPLFRRQIAEFLCAEVLPKLESVTTACAPLGQIDERLRSSTVSKLAGTSLAQLEAFVALCTQKYGKTVCEPGTAVGAIGAQGIGEPCTQMTLKTFHFAGVASMNITLGVPRIKEIIDAMINISTPIITAHLENAHDAHGATAVRARVERTLLGNVCRAVRQIYRHDLVCVQVVLDGDAIEALQLDVNAESVRHAILQCVAPRLKLKEEHIECIDKLTLHVYPTTTERRELLYNLQFLMTELPSVVIFGVPGITRAVIKEVRDDPPEFQLLVEGNALMSVLGTPGIDSLRTTSNHILETYACLGIEAARATIVREIQITMGGHGIACDIRHLMLLAETMTSKGRVLGITRHGVAKMKGSILMLASFETPTDHLFDAAVHSRNDPVVGVSESIILGAPMPIGTGLFNVLHDQSTSSKICDKDALWL
jgi:DNA-directed RNA polymerase III subunit RPC1